MIDYQAEYDKAVEEFRAAYSHYRSVATAHRIRMATDDEFRMARKSAEDASRKVDELEYKLR